MTKTRRPNLPRRAGRPPRARHEAPSLLVLQLDSERLEADGLDLAPFSEFVRLFLPRARAEIVRATSLDDLLMRLADLHGRKFDVVAVVAHSNEQGIVLASGRATDPWEVFGQYLKPFEPRRLVLVACRGGRAVPTRALFTSLPKLRRIFATPVLANRLQGQVMISLLPHILCRPVPSRDLLRTVQAGLAVLQGRQLWEWRRGDFERNKHDPLAPLFENVFADLGQALLLQLGLAERP